MRKRSWFSCFFFLAFAVSLVHTSIPHTHPDKKEKPLASVTDSSGHDHSRHDHGGETEEPSLPVFTHFSNTDYVGNALLKFDARAKYLLEIIAPVQVVIKMSLVTIDRLPFPKPRELPPGRHRSSTSLRAPPFFI